MALIIAYHIRFIISTVDVVLLLRQILDAFVEYKGPGGAATAFEVIANKLNVTRVSALPPQRISSSCPLNAF
jgi:hypothetical protein